MTESAKREYVAILSERYRDAGRVERSLILSELEKNLAIHRKSAIRLMGNGLGSQGGRRGRKRIYNDFVIEHLRRLWIAMGQLCSKRMKRALPRWLKNYDCPDATKVMLIRMGKSTIDHYLKPYRAQYRRHWNSGTRSSKAYLKTKIPLRNLDEERQAQGEVEVDTVHHCGGSMSGVYAVTLTVTDLATGWTECRSMWGLSGKGVVNSMSSIEASLPFGIKRVHVDNGNEFLNHEFLKYFSGRAERVPIHRGRPYRKNDQCYVEQKNFTHVRELFGWERYDQKELIAEMNDIYRNEWSLLQNLFYPQMKLKTKFRVGAKYKKTYDDPQTPLERVLALGSVPPETRARLIELERTINPFELKKMIETKLRAINRILRTTDPKLNRGVPS